MKTLVVWLSLLFSPLILADSESYHSPFTSDVTTAWTVSAATGFAAPMLQNNTYTAFSQQGVFSNIPNRRIEYLQANPYGAQGKQRIVFETTVGKLNLPSGFEVMAQDASEQMDWQRIATLSILGGASGYAGGLSGSLTQQALLSNRFLLLSRLSPTAISGGGVTTSALLAYGLYFLRYRDLESAHRAMTAGLVGSAVGSLATAGLFAVATTFGTASTGTVIASLSGAAAHHAALAWLGGGALSAGGAGMAGGAMVLSGGALLAVVGASAAVMYWFQKDDEKTEQRRIEHLLANLQATIK